MIDIARDSAEAKIAGGVPIAACRDLPFVFLMTEALGLRPVYGLFVKTLGQMEKLRAVNNLTRGRRHEHPPCNAPYDQRGHAAERSLRFPIVKG